MEFESWGLHFHPILKSEGKSQTPLGVGVCDPDSDHNYHTKMYKIKGDTSLLNISLPLRRNQTSKGEYSEDHKPMT